MLTKKANESMGKNNFDWLKATYHFSFADYYNPEHRNFGVLRVFNDDIIGANTGFETHPHHDMEIITYVVEGKLTHEDSMGNKRKVPRGGIQYMSAGTGVYHSEHNTEDTAIRTLQIWIVPDRKGHTPNYGDCEFQGEDRKNKWLHIISSKAGDAPIKVNQDVNFYVLELDKEKEIRFAVDSNRQAYLVQIEGSSQVNDVSLTERDALEIIEEEITIRAQENSHYIIIEMEKEK
jgi:redox-sensitive bicupin YhaK (pirin superfamily)